MLTSILPTAVADIGLLGAFVALSLLSPERLQRFAPTRLAGRLASTPLRGAAAAAGITLVCAMAASVARPTMAEVPDEFAYLLSGDTFASGRLTNPVHPHWEHFESVNILSRPTRQGKYPPLQGIFLAIGRLLFDAPIAGVWLQLALASAALFWTLSVWLPPQWSLVGALLPAIRFGVFVWDAKLSWAYWSASYWGGGATLLAAALLLGGTARLWRAPSLSSSLIAGAGAGLLAYVRPYEGVLVSALLGAYAVGLLLSRIGLRRTIRAVAPGGALAAALVGLLLIYNHRISGSVLTLPHVLYSQQYLETGHFLWSGRNQPLRPESRVGKHHHEFGAYRRSVRQDRIGIPRVAQISLVAFFLGPVLLLCLLFLPLYFRSSGAMLGAALFGAALVAHLPTTTSTVYSHYLAPAVPGLLLLISVALHRIESWSWRGRPLGAGIAEGAVAACLVTFVASVSLRAAFYERDPLDFPVARLALQEKLVHDGEPSIVFVRYSRRNAFGPEWTQNAADIDAQKVVWATDLGPDKNADLLDYYPERRAWLVDVSDPAHPVTPYPR